jgi:glycosyltransferase involved in cell wall biosynthesis
VNQGEVDFKVSLVIPVRNEVASLEALVRSIREQTRPPDEVILVDGGSTDDTVALARRLTVDDPRFRIIEAGPATPGRGRNVGIAAARNDWIALTDAGLRLEPTWLERLVAATGEGVEVVYGNYEPICESWFERCAALAYVAPKVSRAGRRMRGPFIASSLITRGVWRKSGEFPDLRAAEDLIFMERIQAGGCEIRWAPTATVWWQLRPNLLETFRRFSLYSCHTAWAGRVRDWHLGVARQYAVLAVLVWLALAHSGWWWVVIALAAAARVTKSIWQRWDGGWRSTWLIPFDFVLVGIILFTLDIATFWGWLASCSRGRPQASAAASRIT